MNKTQSLVVDGNIYVDIFIIVFIFRFIVT